MNKKAAIVNADLSANKIFVGSTCQSDLRRQVGQHEQYLSRRKYSPCQQYVFGKYKVFPSVTTGNQPLASAVDNHEEIAVSVYGQLIGLR